MGQHRRPGNLGPTSAAIADGRPIRCADEGSAAATIVDASLAGAVGTLTVRDIDVVLVVAGDVVAEIAGDRRLRACVDEGIGYSGVLEVDDGPPRVSFWR